jgi:serine/threonine protein kinase
MLLLCVNRVMPKRIVSGRRKRAGKGSKGIRVGDITTIIGKGQYGCVVRPSLKCRSKSPSSQRSVTKLQRIDSSLEETKSLRAINKSHVDENEEYFIHKAQPCEYSELDQSELQAVTAECFPDGSLRPDNLMALTYLYGGDELDNWIRMHHDNLASVKPNDVLLAFANLFTGLHLLHSSDEHVYHLDVKPPNIVVSDELPMHMRLIDFGLTSTALDIFTREPSLFFLTVYVYWPPEIVLFLYCNRDVGPLVSRVEADDMFQKWEAEMTSGAYGRDIASISFGSADPIQDIEHLFQLDPAYIDDLKTAGRTMASAAMSPNPDDQTKIIHMIETVGNICDCHGALMSLLHAMSLFRQDEVPPGVLKQIAEWIGIRDRGSDVATFLKNYPSAHDFSIKIAQLANSHLRSKG